MDTERTETETQETEETLQESLVDQLRSCAMLMGRMARAVQRDQFMETMKEEFPGAHEAWEDFRQSARTGGERLKTVLTDGFAVGARGVEDLRNRNRQREVAHGQNRLLQLLQERDGRSLSELVDELDIRPSSASELVSKLEQQGLVRRETNADDKRVVNIFITDAGRERCETNEAARAKRDAEIFSGLTDREQKQLSKLLRKLADSLKERLG